MIEFLVTYTCSLCKRGATRSVSRDVVAEAPLCCDRKMNAGIGRLVGLPIIVSPQVPPEEILSEIVPIA